MIIDTNIPQLCPEKISKNQADRYPPSVKQCGGNDAKQEQGECLATVEWQDVPVHLSTGQDFASALGTVYCTWTRVNRFSAKMRQIHTPAMSLDGSTQPRQHFSIGFCCRYERTCSLPRTKLPAAFFHQPPLTWCLNCSILASVMPMSRLGAWWFNKTLHIGILCSSIQRSQWNREHRTEPMDCFDYMDNDMELWFEENSRGINISKTHGTYLTTFSTL